MTSLSRRAAGTTAVALSIFLLTTGCWPFQRGASNPTSSPIIAAGGSSPAATASSTTPSPTAPPTQASTGMSGTWTGTWANLTPDHSTGTFTLTWTQNGANLSGTITITGTPCLNGGSITGTVVGPAISFGAVNGAVSVNYDGTVSGNHMAGTYSTDCGNAKGNWSATKK